MKRVVIGLTVVAIVVALYEFALPGIVQHVATSNLRRIQAEQVAAFGPAVTAITDGRSSTSMTDCGATVQGRWHTHISCVANQVYDSSSTPLPASSRDAVVNNSRILDRLLLAKGWSLDRPGDPVTTIAGSVPSQTLPDGTGAQPVPYHKDIGSISCNLVIAFTGPTDGISPGIVNVNDFSCTETATYLVPHIFTHSPSAGYGG